MKAKDIKKLAEDLRENYNTRNPFELAEKYGIRVVVSKMLPIDRKAYTIRSDNYPTIIIINGSARKGNTLTAINALIKGASEKNEIEVIEPDKLQIAPCKGCGACQCHKGCVDNDDTNPTIDKIAAADMILFTTPVYWWGMSAQLKLVIDKCYCRGLQLKNKKVGVIAVGGSPVDSIQYELINKQFDCMADYLSWDMLFQKSYYASEKTDLAKDENSLKELEDIGKNL